MILANDDPYFYSALNGKTLKESQQIFGPISDIQIANARENEFGILITYDKIGTVEFWFTKKFDTYRANIPDGYLEFCQFVFWEDSMGEAHIRFGKWDWKPQKNFIYADDYAKRFKHLHYKRFRESHDLENFIEYEFYNKKDIDYGILFRYEDPLKQDILFRFSHTIDIQRAKSDSHYLNECQFVYWEDESGENIRLSKPFIFIETTGPSLIERE